jgi:hypothetical protein
MPNDGATVFSDLTGKLEVLRVSCDKCGRDGCYGLHRLIEKRGRSCGQRKSHSVAKVRGENGIGRPT